MKTIGGFLCLLGLHHDGTDVFGGHSPVCLRCNKSLLDCPRCGSRHLGVEVTASSVIPFCGQCGWSPA